MKKERGLYQPTYRDKRTGEVRTAAVRWIRYHWRGELYRESSDSTSRTVAKQLLNKRLGEIGRGQLVGPTVEKTTFEDLAAMLTADYAANQRRSTRRLTTSLKHLQEYFGHYRAIDITVDRVTAYVAHRQGQDGAAASINRELAALKRALSLAEAAGRIAQRPRFSVLREHNTRSGFFEPDQFAAVLKELPDYLKPLVQTAYITGWRVPSELCTRQRHHLDLDHGWLRLDPGESKNSEGRLFALTPELRTILIAQLERTRSLELATGCIITWLFHRDGNQIKDFRFAWEKACRLAGVPGRLVHDFRRTAVRNLERAGVPRSPAMKMTGHKTEAVYRRYAIVDESMMRDAADKLAALHVADATTERTVIPLKRAAL